MADVWTVRLDVAAPAARSLTADDRRRASAIKDPETRRRFVVAHAALNAILADLLGVRPQDLPLDRTPRGRPFLTGTPVHFSLAHAGELALVAVAGRELGVDVDHPRPGLDPRQMAARFFTADEASEVDAAGTSAYRRYLRLWTRKEACVKAAGSRLALGLRLPVAGEVVHDPTGRLGGPFFVRDLPIVGDHVGAVALAGAEPAACRVHSFYR
ncbi:4'-phosphopantetheinyl transferase superfamily protein [Actinoplanes bogorensis]|uniref:4'-phosphopantetheinyl transferase superfamily protein n=1 Tax=Paractinoplanes bogorensis TaxID=1610840 RepID=A0ABS5YR09_9ACTN|nr:4'-phosphopantetheinyl transferase superfamily protein [Actinoplanes bogorensis]MBU2665893.1 4'-phosphopantetheinyl transferase superfamily protein [Actinoplanes bogorensis]